jgi:hypothetical protein
VKQDNECLREELAVEMRNNPLDIMPYNLTIEELAGLDRIPEGINQPLRQRPPAPSDAPENIDVIVTTSTTTVDLDQSRDLEPPIEVMRPRVGGNENAVEEEEPASPAPSMQVSDTEMEEVEEAAVSVAHERAGPGLQQ